MLYSHPYQQKVGFFMEKTKILSFKQITAKDYAEGIDTDIIPKDSVIKVDVVSSLYALIDTGDGKRCAWCNRKAEKIKNLDKHLQNHQNKCN